MKVILFIIRAWRRGTINQYKPYLGKWESYCSQQKINPLCATAVVGMNFLAELFLFGVGYSAINTAQSALSSKLILPDNTTFGSHPLVSRMLKGVFALRPAYLNTKVSGTFPWFLICSAVGTFRTFPLNTYP